MYKTRFHNEDLSNKTFLVTGGAGFIGSHLVEYLLTFNAGKVIVLDNLSTGFRKNLELFFNYPNLEFIEGDIRDPETCKRACTGVDIVFHQAALGSVPRSINDPFTTNQVNIDGFLNMLIASRDQGVDRFIYAASSSTYGDSKTLPKVEDKIGSPLSPYAVTKYVNELYAKVFASTYGMKTIGLRYFNVFGPRQSPKGAYAAVIPLFISAAIHEGTVYIDGDGEQTRDFTFVENAVQANIKAAFTNNEEAFNEIYNVAIGENTSINNLISNLKKYSGCDFKVLNRESRQGDVRDSLAEISKIRKILGYDPTIRLEQGLNITYDWFKSNKDFIES